MGVSRSIYQWDLFSLVDTCCHLVDEKSFFIDKSIFQPKINIWRGNIIMFLWSKCIGCLHRHYTYLWWQHIFLAACSHRPLIRSCSAPVGNPHVSTASVSDCNNKNNAFVISLIYFSFNLVVYLMNMLYNYNHDNENAWSLTHLHELIAHRLDLIYWKSENIIKNRIIIKIQYLKVVSMNVH